MSRSCTLLLLFCGLLSLPLFAQPGTRRCAAHQIWEHKAETHPEMRSKRQLLEMQIQNWMDDQKYAVRSRSTITIPVVVHVVWNKGEENNPDEQVFSQIDVLNRDFRGQNDEFSTIPEAFKDEAADTEIEFCLASIDPKGNSTTGIVRRRTDVSCIGDKPGELKYDLLGGSDAWDTEYYLNIWVAGKCDGILGYASFPGEDIPEEDGIVVDYKAFGTTGVAAGNRPFEKGRTATHEVGHYFNLFHLWGPLDDDGRVSCELDDAVEDTPMQSNTYQGECPVGPAYSCGTADMYMNYMNFTDDACMSMFTAGQRDRMLATLEVARPGLKESIGCATVNTSGVLAEANNMDVFPNPASESIQIFINTTIPRMAKLSLINNLGQVLFCSNTQSKFYHTIPTAELPNGIYYVKSQIDDQYAVKKVIIAK